MKTAHSAFSSALRLQRLSKPNSSLAYFISAAAGMSRHFGTSDGSVSTRLPSADGNQRNRKRRRSTHTAPSASAIQSSHPSVSASASLPFASTPSASFVTLSTSSGRTITRRMHDRTPMSLTSTTSAAHSSTPHRHFRNYSSSSASSSANSSREFSASSSAINLTSHIATLDTSLTDATQPITISLPAPLPPVIVLPVTSSHLATALPALVATAHHALTLLPFFTRSPVTQKQIIHSLLVSSHTQSLLLTFASLPHTSPLPAALLGVLGSSSPVALLLPTELSKRALSSGLSGWQRPPNFTVSKHAAYLTPFLIDLLSLTTTDATTATTAAATATATATTAPVTPVVAWSDKWTTTHTFDRISSNSNSNNNTDNAALIERLSQLSEYSTSQLTLYESAYQVSEELTTYATQQFNALNSFNLRFLPLLPISPYRFTLDTHTQLSLPRMQLPTNHRVHITRNHSEAERAITHLLASLSSNQQQSPIIGFDTESRATFVAGQPNRPISLIQLSSLTVSVLCRVNTRTGLPPALIKLLLDPNVRKVGQGIGGDVRLLHTQYSGSGGDAQLPDTLLTSPSLHSLVDLETLSSAYSIHRVGLASLTAAFLSLNLSKAAQLSNWEAHTLSSEQVSYAALDSLVSLKLAIRLHALREQVQHIVRGWLDRQRQKQQKQGAESVPGDVISSSVDGGSESSGGGDVSAAESKVWQWVTGKSLDGVVEAKARQEKQKEKEKEKEAGKKKHTPTTQHQHAGSSGSGSKQSHTQQQQQQQRADKRQKVASQPSSTAADGGSGAARRPHKARRWVAVERKTVEVGARE